MRIYFKNELSTTSELCILVRQFDKGWRYTSHSLTFIIVLLFTFIFTDILGIHPPVATATGTFGHSNCNSQNCTPWNSSENFYSLINCTESKRSFNYLQQCLVLHEEYFSDVICSLKPIKSGQTQSHRMKRIRSDFLPLPFCTMYNFYSVIGEDCGLEGSKDECQRCLGGLLTKDAAAKRDYIAFIDMFTHYDCSKKNKYSVKWTCDDCKMAYKHWLCSRHIDSIHINNERYVPCDMDHCERVEEACPYLLPTSDGQYAGEPGFLCRDEEILTSSSNDQQKCFKFCYFNDSQTDYGNDNEKNRCLMDPQTSSSSSNHNTESSSRHKLLAHLALVWLICTFLPNMVIGLT
ncbi:unnamed protein product [Owenia fusiformis]|uniref:Uncharacterized protein n=1 Tax=Owenia fusiformis TaxID=6347 RepID=A0A8J1UCF7_OWEFU|nr:unnamed protein product [Owenia fusiformis]